MFKKFFWSPYRFNYHGKFRLILAIVVFLTSFYITYYMEAHNVFLPEHKMDFIWICLIHSAIPTVIFASTTWVLEYKFRAKERWRLISEFALGVGLILLIGVANFLIRDLIYDNPFNWTVEKFNEELLNTLSIGVLICSIIIFLGYFLQLRKNVAYAPAPSTSLLSSSERLSLLEITSNVKKETFLLNPNALLYAKSDGNYTEIFLTEENQVVKTIKRITLSDFKVQLDSENYILRVHKSFLVNLNAIEEVSGNSAGLKLRLKNLNGTHIPVSRKNISIFESQRNSLSS